MRDRWSAVLAVSGRRGPRNAWNTRIGRDPGRASDRRVARPGWGALRRYIPAYLSRVAPLSRRTRPPVAVAQAPDAEEPGLPAASVPWRARPTSPAVPARGQELRPWAVQYWDCWALCRGWLSCRARRLRLTAKSRSHDHRLEFRCSPPHRPRPLHCRRCSRRRPLPRLPRRLTGQRRAGRSREAVWRQGLISGGKRPLFP